MFLMMCCITEADYKEIVMIDYAKDTRQKFLLSNAIVDEPAKKKNTLGKKLFITLLILGFLSLYIR